MRKTPTVPLKISTTAGLVVDQFTQNSPQWQTSGRPVVASTKWENAPALGSATSCTLSPSHESWDATCIQDVAESNPAPGHQSDPDGHRQLKDVTQTTETEETQEMAEIIAIEEEVETGTEKDATKTMVDHATGKT